jgi:predicted transposase YbfD/YdcC
VFYQTQEASMTAKMAPPLMTALAKVPDFRKSQGQRHRLVAILALSVAAVMCGAQSLTAISQWGREQGAVSLQRLGLTHLPGPCVATLHRIFKDLNVQALESVLTAWWNSWLPPGGGLAVDGKTARGSQTESHAAVQLLVAFAQRLSVALAECAIVQHDEIGAAATLLGRLDLAGWVITGDAKFTQKQLAAQITAAQGDYALIVKENQPTLYQDIATLYRELDVVADTVTTTRDCTCHGQRIERRVLTASNALRDYCAWPGLEQVFRIARTVIDKRSGTRTQEVHYGITSLTPAEADARRLAELVRGHWRIENRLHWVRDKDFGEDASRVRTGNAPQAMAIFRNLVISLLWLLGYPCVIAALRHFASHADAAISLVTDPLPIPARARMK